MRPVLGPLAPQRFQSSLLSLTPFVSQAVISQISACRALAGPRPRKKLS